MNWKQFLQNKGISLEDYAKKSVEEMAQLTNEYNTEVRKELEAKIDKAASKEDFNALKTQLENLTKENADLQIKATLEDLTEKVNQLKENATVTANTNKTVKQELDENKDTLKAIAKGFSPKEVVVKALSNRASVANNENAYDLPDIGQLATRKSSLYDIFPKLRVNDNNDNGTILIRS